MFFSRMVHPWKETCPEIVMSNGSIGGRVPKFIGGSDGHETDAESRSVLVRGE